MEYRLNISSLKTPEEILALKKAISEIASDCDVLYSETALNGNISARIGRRAIYNNGGTYTFWVNVDGGTMWRQLTDSSTELWVVDGTETQLRTADEIDMQSKKIINVTDPTNNQDAATKKYHDDDISAKMNISTGHDHDGSDSKQVAYSSLSGAPTVIGNVLAFCVDAQVESTGAGDGEYIGTSLIPNAQTGNYRFRQSNLGSYATVWTGKFLKTAGVSTVTVWAQLWHRVNEARYHRFKCIIGTVNGVGLGANGDVTPTWVSATVDVSGLVNGTTYDVSMQIDTEVTTNDVYLGTFMGITS